MAKIDVSKIEGYGDLTAEEKLKVLESYEFEPPAQDTGEIEKLKALLTKSNSEAAEYKRQLKAKMTDEEAKAAKEAEERAALEKELGALRRDKAVSEFTAKYLELGYDAETAKTNAESLHAGDFATIFANQKKFIEAQRKAAAAGALDQQPGLTVGEPVSGKNVESAAVSAFRKAAGIG